MRRLFVLMALAMASVATPAMAMDCEKEARVVLDQMMKSESINMDTSEMIRVSRFVTLAFDACKAGEMQSAKSFFEMAAKSSGR